MAYTDREDLNYLGELFLIGNTQTPFLNRIGGLGGARAKISRSFIFPVAQPWSLASASQPAITEAQSVTGQTPTTVARGQDTNTVQIFQKAVESSYAKQSTYGEISGLAALGTQPVTDELAFQKQAQLRQIAIDAEYSMLNGAYQASANASTAAKMRGILTAISTNAVDASSASLIKSLVDVLLRSMAANGAQFEDMWCYANALQKQLLTDIYGNQTQNDNRGGMNVTQIETDFCMLNVQYAPNVPTDTLGIFDMAYVYPVFCPVPGKPGGGLMFYEEKMKAGASVGGQFYGQIGIDYGPEEYHGKITGLATT